MSSNPVPPAIPLAGPVAPPGGRPHPDLPVRRAPPPPGYVRRSNRGIADAINRRRITNANRRLANALSNPHPVAPFIPQPKKEIRVYTLEELADRINVEAALAEHFARSQEGIAALLASAMDIAANGVTYIGFDRTGSRILPKWELVNYVLATKSVAIQVRDALKLVPIPLIITINLTVLNPFSTDNELGAPTIAEGEASNKEELEKIVPFHFKELPNEIRHMIYGFSSFLAIGHDNQIAPFAQAALCDKFLKDEIKAAYKQLNYRVTLENELRFGRIVSQKIEFIGNLYLQSGNLGQDRYKHKRILLCAARCQLTNNFRTLSEDYTTADSDPQSFSTIQTVSRASSGVSRISVRLWSMTQLEVHARRNLNSVKDVLERRCRLIHDANLWIRTPGRLATVGTGDVAEEWFWEREGGLMLNLGPEGMARRKNAPTKGRKTLADALAGRSIMVR